MDASMNNKVSASSTYPSNFTSHKDDQAMLYHPHMEMTPNDYDATGQKPYHLNIHPQPTRLWNASTISHGLAPSPTITASVAARSDHQALQLPSFMANTLYAPNAKPAMATAPHMAPKSQYYSASFSGRKPAREPLGSPSQFVNYASHAGGQTGTRYSKKISAAPPSNSSDFGSAGTNASNFDSRSDGADSRSNTISSAETRPKNNSAINFSEASGNDAVEVLKLELLFKSQINKSLNDKLSLLKSESAELKASAEASGEQIKLPNNYYQLFRDLTRTLNERTKELEETKLRIEAILVGLVMTKDTSITSNGTFDAQELAHRITNKLAVLQSENEALLDMVSHSNKQSLLIELGLLKNENKILREKLKDNGKE